MKATEFQRRCGLTYRQVDYMVTTRRIEPAYRARGSGDKHLFRQSQAEVIRALTPVLKLGIWPDLAEVERLMLDGTKAIWLLFDGTLTAGPDDWQPAIWLPLT